MSEELKIAKQWLAKAKNDLLNADNNLKSDEIPFDTVCFHCQQAAEKLRDTLAILMPYAVEIRYPDDWFMPSEDDAKEAREAAGKVLKWLERAIPELFKKNEEESH